MKRALWLCAVMMLVGAAPAFAVGYTFIGTKFNETLVATGVYGANWDNAVNWNPARILPGTTADSYYVAKDGTGAWLTATTNVGLPNPGGAGNTRYFGSITVDNGNLYVPTAATGTYRFQADNTQPGSLIMTGLNSRLNRAYSGSKVNFVMDGNFIVDPVGAQGSAGWWGETAAKCTVTMKGVGTTYQFDSVISRDSSMYYVTVDNNARVNFAPCNGGVSNAMSFLELKRGTTVSGTVLILWSGKTQLIESGANVDHTNLDLRLLPVSAYFTKPNPNLTNYYAGGGQLVKGTFRDLEFGLGVNGTTYDNADYTGHLIGALHLRNLYAGYLGIAGFTGNGGANYIIDTDNQYVGSSNLTIDQNLILGADGPSGWSKHKNGALKANSSQVKVGGNVNLKYVNDGGYTLGGYILGGTATFRVGGNWTVDCGTLSGRRWDMGTSLVIFDGNGTSTAQTLTTRGLPFYDVSLSNPGGTVTLADNLNLKGDFKLIAGTFNPATFYLNFKGGVDCETTAQEIDVAGIDLHRVRIMAGSSSFAKLMSNLTVSDNLDIDAGCKLFLNGFTLTAINSDLKQNYSGAGTWTVREGGEIVGAAVPEPATLLLMGTGALGALGYIRRRRMS